MQAPILQGVLSQVITTITNTPYEYIRTAGVGNTTQSFSFDIGLANKQRLILITHTIEAETVPTSITVDGKACTLVADIINTDSIGNVVSLWYIAESTLGSSNGTVTLTSNGATIAGLNAYLFYGVRTEAVVSYESQNTLTASSSVSVTASPTSNSLTFMCNNHGSTGLQDNVPQPLVERTAVNPNSAITQVVFNREILAQTNKKYEMFSDYMNRAATIVAWWQTEPARDDGTLLQTIKITFGADTQPSPQTGWNLIGESYDKTTDGAFTLMADDGSTSGFDYETTADFVALANSLSTVSTKHFPNDAIIGAWRANGVGVIGKFKISGLNTANVYHVWTTFSNGSAAQDFTHTCDQAVENAAQNITNDTDRTSEIEWVITSDVNGEFEVQVVNNAAEQTVNSGRISGIYIEEWGAAVQFLTFEDTMNQLQLLIGADYRFIDLNAYDITNISLNDVDNMEEIVQSLNYTYAHNAEVSSLLDIIDVELNSILRSLI